MAASPGRVPSQQAGKGFHQKGDLRGGAPSKGNRRGRLYRGPVSVRWNGKIREETLSEGVLLTDCGHDEVERTPESREELEANG
jgi:hypothetical protein